MEVQEVQVEELTQLQVVRLVVQEIHLLQVLLKEQMVVIQRHQLMAALVVVEVQLLVVVQRWAVGVQVELALIWFKLVLQDVMEHLVPYLEQDIFLVGGGGGSGCGGPGGVGGGGKGGDGGTDPGTAGTTNSGGGGGGTRGGTSVLVDQV